MKIRMSLAALTVAACVAALLSPTLVANATTLGASDFLKASGSVLKNRGLPPV